MVRLLGCRIVGRREDELLALTFQNITHPDDVDADVEEMQRLIDGELDSCRLEERYLLLDGTEKWVSLSAAAVRDDDGPPLHFISQVEDVDARKRSVPELGVDYDQGFHLGRPAPVAGLLTAAA